MRTGNDRFKDHRAFPKKTPGRRTWYTIEPRVARWFTLSVAFALHFRFRPHVLLSVFLFVAEWVSAIRLGETEPASARSAAAEWSRFSSGSSFLDDC
jgi:hypothetical protein